MKKESRTRTLKVTSQKKAPAPVQPPLITVSLMSLYWCHLCGLFLIDVIVIGHFTGLTADSVIVRVSDGKFSSKYTVPIILESRTLRSVKNGPVFAFPSTDQTISETDLAVISNDKDSEVLYSVSEGPTQGKLLIAEQPVDKFTQADVEGGRVIYRPDPSAGCEYEDYITYTARDTVGPKLNEKRMQIRVFPWNVNPGNVDRLIHTTHLVVLEGKSAVISSNVLDISRMLHILQTCERPTQLSAAIIQHPTHGSVTGQLSDGTIQADDIQAGKLIYTHDDSETLYDNITFSFNLRQGHIVFEVSHLISLQVLVSSMNDQPPMLKNFNYKLSVFPATITNISTDIMDVSDSDSTPQNLFYKITSQPALLEFVYLPEVIATTLFTQEDIRVGRVALKVLFGIQLQEHKITYTVTDGAFVTAPGLLRVEVVPIDLRVTHSGPLTLLQGTVQSVLYPSILKAASKSPKHRITYRVIRAPVYGHLILGGKRVTAFTQQDIEQGRIMYRQHSMSSHDMLQLTVSAGNIESIPVTLQIIVQPNIIKRKPFLITGDGPSPLGIENLDAGSLLHLVKPGAEAVYSVTAPPRYGRLEIMTKHRKRRAIDEQSFTHSDIVAGTVLYHPPDPIPAENDSFDFTLSCDGAQPARGNMTISFNTTFSAEPVSRRLDESLLTVLAAVFSLILCGAVLFIVVCCLRRINNKREVEEKTKAAEEPKLILAKENGSYKLLVAGCDDFAITPHSVPTSPTRSVDAQCEPEVSCTMPGVRVTPLISTLGHTYNLKDFLPSISDRYTASCSSVDGRQSIDENTSYQGGSSVLDTSAEHLPSIRRPNYLSYSTRSCPRQ